MNVLTEKIVKTKRLLTKYLNPEKAAHCVRVATTARDIALAHKYESPDKAYLAGLLHDLARNLPTATLFDLARENDLVLLDHEKTHPVLLHGKIAAIIARKELAINDQDILDAIENHTLGRKDMSTLEKIIYVADFIEPHREYPSSAIARELAKTDLELAVAEKARAVLKYSEQNGMYAGEFQQETASGS